MPGKGLKDPRDSGPEGETCDCLGEGEEYEAEGGGKGKGKGESEEEDLDKEDSGDEEERKESFEAVQFKSNQKKGKGLLILISSLKHYISLPQSGWFDILGRWGYKVCSRQSLIIFLLS